jgi:hypothetical protein
MIKKGFFAIQSKVRRFAGLLIGAHDWIRTSTPVGTTPSRWRVYQFHHVGIFYLNERMKSFGGKDNAFHFLFE